MKFEQPPEAGKTRKQIFLSSFQKSVALVCSHTAIKNCLRLGNLSRGLIDSQFIMAGEVSGNLQSWRKGKQIRPSSHDVRKC